MATYVLDLFVVAELSDGIYAEGGVIDSRNVRLDVWEVVDKLRLSDVSYFLRLNHSRLITSQLKWPSDLNSILEVRLNRTSYIHTTPISINYHALKSLMLIICLHG